MKKIMPLQTGVSERGEWKSREVILEEIDERIQFPNQYLVRFTADRVNLVDSIKEGDIVSVDVGAYIGGFHGDCAATYPCGKVSDEAMKLIRVTQQSFWEGMKYARQGCRVSDIGHAVQTYVESHGFGVVRAFVGHGVGEKMHEEPEIPNYGSPGRGPRMVKGMTLAIEPMVTEGTYDVRVLKDGWTTVTADGKLAAHYENSILITDGEPEILTVPEGL